jgi:hypothetical protein
MKIDLYTRCWNDLHMLGFFFRHYDRYVQRYVIFDDGSTDGSCEFLQTHPKVELRTMPPPSDPLSRIASGVAVLESCWQESRGSADWVIVTDIDEHIFHPHDLANYLSACKARGITIIPSLGYEMMAEEFPQGDLLLCRSVTTGARWDGMDKMNIFSPNDVAATNFAPGRHLSEPTGTIVAPASDESLLLHYRHLGFERTFARHALARSRQRPKDLESGWGFQYSWTRNEFREHWGSLLERVVDISNPSVRQSDTRSAERWWDRYRLPT